MLVDVDVNLSQCTLVQLFPYNIIIIVMISVLGSDFAIMRLHCATWFHEANFDPSSICLEV
jgi:hypothetical protein